MECAPYMQLQNEGKGIGEIGSDLSEIFKCPVSTSHSCVTQPCLNSDRAGKRRDFDLPFDHLTHVHFLKNNLAKLFILLNEFEHGMWRYLQLVETGYWAKRGLMLVLELSDHNNGCKRMKEGEEPEYGLWWIFDGACITYTYRAQNVAHNCNKDPQGGRGGSREGQQSLHLVQHPMPAVLRKSNTLFTKERTWVGSNGCSHLSRWQWAGKETQSQGLVAPPSQPCHVPSSNPTAKGQTLPVPDRADTREAGQEDYAHTAMNFALHLQYFVRSGGSIKGWGQAGTVSSWLWRARDSRSDSVLVPGTETGTAKAWVVKEGGIAVGMAMFLLFSGILLASEHDHLITAVCQ
ncbi:hypothetical protein B0H34DRAFT_670713 [Crassisporium funariophilum]|nr:hypothetical protein B0H34DRAFT_670713 [Crassisporium funariophilum]